MSRPAGAWIPIVAFACTGAMYLASCEGDVQRAAPPANRPLTATTTFTSGDTVDTVGSGAGGTFDTTGLGGWGGDFGSGGGFDDDGAAGSGGDESDADVDGCAVGPTGAFYLSDLNWIGTPTNGAGP